MSNIWKRTVDSLPVVPIVDQVDAVEFEQITEPVLVQLAEFGLVSCNVNCRLIVLSKQAQIRNPGPAHKTRPCEFLPGANTDQARLEGEASAEPVA
jgi:hypothetical protein